MLPKIRYAKSRNVHVAYQVVGKGPPDLVFFLGWLTHGEALWRLPAMQCFLDGLASFSRLILFDKRGIGLSDPASTAAPPTLEEWMDDVDAVLDAVGSTRTTLLGHGTGGQMAIAYAGRRPERVASLVLANTYARLFRDSDYPWGLPLRFKEAIVASHEQAWGTAAQLGVLAPSVAGDEDVQEWWATFQKIAASPSTAVAIQRAIHEIDVRASLSRIAARTLILHRRGNRPVRVEHGRYLAERIAGARYVELEGSDHWIWTGGAGAMLDEIQEFLTGVRPAAGDRVVTQPGARDAQSVMRKEGDYWTVIHEGRTLRVRHSKGLLYLARLLAHPGTDVHVLDLAALGAERSSVGNDLDTVIDPRAAAEYRKRLSELREELVEATAANDLGRAERKREEGERIAQALAGAYGLGGRPRKTGDPAERARKAVTNQIRRSIERLHAEHPSLALHLDNSLRTGLVCSYTPDRPIVWRVST